MRRGRAGFVFAAVVAGCAGAPPSIPPESRAPSGGSAAAPRAGASNSVELRGAPSGEPADRDATSAGVAEAQGVRVDVDTTRAEPAPPEAADLPDAAGTKNTPPAPRLTSTGYTTKIWARPKVTELFIGYVRVGQSVALKSTERVKGEGCSGGFYAIEPRGYVCNDRTITLSGDPKLAEAMDATRAAAGPFPYRYAISNGAPMYNRIPTPAEQAKAERMLGPAGKWRPLIKSLSAHEDLAEPKPIAPVDPVPSFLAGGRQVADTRMGLVREAIPHGSMLAFTRAFEAEGRTWLLSADLTIVPADRVRAFRPSAFRGVRLGSDVKLPLAWMRKSAKPKHRMTEAGVPARADASWPAQAFVGLTGASVEHGGARYLETTEREGGASGRPLYIAEADATVVEPAKKLPSGVAKGQKWIHVRITKGTLVAYEGMTPVYATLMSPGSGGVPVKGYDPVKMSTTPTGTYYVTFKDKAATMSPDKEGEPRTLWIADVPHTQYFNPPFALHAAYWHERFGEPTSAGCVNVSPIDAEALFQWSDPKVPDEWQGATGSGAPMNGPTTAVVVSR